MGCCIDLHSLIWIGAQVRSFGIMNRESERIARSLLQGIFNIQSAHCPNGLEALSE